jgi:4-hydroxybenzoate polyprenyltransferase
VTQAELRQVDVLTKAVTHARVALLTLMVLVFGTGVALVIYGAPPPVLWVSMAGCFLGIFGLYAVDRLRDMVRTRLVIP